MQCGIDNSCHTLNDLRSIPCFFEAEERRISSSRPGRGSFYIDVVSKFDSGRPLLEKLLRHDRPN
jgi:hypothetical protein